MTEKERWALVLFRHLPPEPLARKSRGLAARLGGDLFQFAGLQGGEGAGGAALLGVGEGAAVGLHPLAHRFEDLALPLGELDAGLVGLGLGALQGLQARALDPRLLLGALLLPRGRRFILPEAQSPPMAER
jgi:hypothetical protein